MLLQHLNNLGGKVRVGFLLLCFFFCFSGFVFFFIFLLPVADSKKMMDAF